ncbi:MAG TPA: amidohydrolase family protein [Verrucomicrobiae bacterium]|nr:amidohydrolase family protein [Verrucomicrobiae bacterium]
MISNLKSQISNWRAKAWWFAVCVCVFPGVAGAQTLLLSNAIIHTVSGDTISRGSVLIRDGKIAGVFNLEKPGEPALPSGARIIDLQGGQLYPGLIALDSVVGLSEIEGVRATLDTAEVGDYTPDVESWIAVNPDSELIPVTRANGIGYFEPSPQGGVVSGQSALLAMDGWTFEQMVVKKPAALHVYWPGFDLNVTPKERFADPSKWKSLEDQGKERRKKLRALEDFFEEAKAYAGAKNAAAQHRAEAPKVIPAWEAMLPYVRGESPIFVHADELRQIQSAEDWARTNHYRICLVGGQDAWRVAELLASNQIPVIYERVFTQPPRDSDSYDVTFSGPGILQKAGVKVLLGLGADTFIAPLTRNLPYAAAQAVAFGLPAPEALKAITLYPAQVLGLDSRIGSIEPGKEATVFLADGDIFDIRTRVRRMWIAGNEINLENRHTRLYEKYQNRPKAP